MNSTATVSTAGISPAALNSTDEMWLQDGKIKEHWNPVYDYFNSLRPKNIKSLKQSILRLIHENGITYTSHGQSGSADRLWQLDPVPLVLSPEDWTKMESGLLQRAKLLNLVLDDIYGPRNLLREGLLPPELIFSHPEFLRPCCGVPGSRELIQFAADMARGPDGRMWVINDRTQAPSGGGYALENRDVLNQLFPALIGQAKVRRLASFFRKLKATFQSLAPNHKEDPRIVILTPGSFAETYFEHAYLAAYLGITLVQGDDLTVRDNQVWLRSLAELEPVDVIVRRVDSSFCDPLAFRSDSFLGVPGLMNAVRAGNVALANPLGCGILENPGLMAFLPKICRFFFGHELELPSAATWWCGQKKELQYVLENADKLVIKSIGRTPVLGSVFGAELSSTELDELRNRIKARPYQYVGQEAVSFSTMPCLTDKGLEQRHGVLRGMVAAIGKGSGEYIAMPGGLTRGAGMNNTHSVSNSEGGVSKDTWVLAENSVPYDTLWEDSNDPYELAHDERNLPSRAGENLFWAGRYAERAEGTARILRRSLRVYFSEVLQGMSIDGAQLQLMLDTLYAVTGGEVEEPQKHRNKKQQTHPLEKKLIPFLRGSTIPGTLGFTLKAFSNSCFAVRDLWSYDSWRVIQTIETQRLNFENSKKRPLEKYLDDLNELLTQMMALVGLNLESMTRQAGWLMLDTGRRLERSQWLINVIQSMLVESKMETQLTSKLENLLAATGSLVTHQRRYRTQPRVETVLELILFDETYPRSVIYQLDRVQSHAALLPEKTSHSRLREDQKLLLQAITKLKLCDVSTLAHLDSETSKREDLEELLKELTNIISGISEHLTLYYFSHVSPSHLLA